MAFYMKTTFIMLVGLTIMVSAVYPTVYLEDNAVPSKPLGATFAGVPRYWGENRDYDAWFQALAEVGTTAFLPYSAYQELPESLSLGYEADFFPPCRYDAPAFQALRDHQIKLIAAGSLLYPTVELPSIDQDPLRALLDCTGDGMIAAVYSIDEPAYQALLDPANSDVYEHVEALYRRVKAIDPTLPVLMVHGPIRSEIQEADGTFRPTTQTEIDQYLDAVKKLSDYADIIAFDLYPIPAEIGHFPAPGQGVSSVDYTIAFPSYLQWLEEVAGDKPYFIVLQAFSFERQLSAEMAREVIDAGFAVRPPTLVELQDMACLSFEGGASEIGWWGQSFLIEGDETLWENVLDVTHNMTSDPHRYCEMRMSSLGSILNSQMNFASANGS